MKDVRLTNFTIEAIRTAFRENFLKEDHVWLFGSRVDLSQRGGDIDLYIESTIQDARQVAKAKLNFLAKLYMLIGEQKIDVVIKFDDTDLPIYKIAKQEGRQLL